MNSPIAVQYALMCLQELDQRNSEALSPQDISARQGIPLPECEGILHRLEEAGLVDCPEKTHFALTRPIEELKVLEILQALWAPQNKVTAFKILFQSQPPALRKTLEAVSSAQQLSCFPSEGSSQGCGN
jgi:DNA-binding IscR family transcriptional regulator